MTNKDTPESELSADDTPDRRGGTQPPPEHRLLRNEAARRIGELEAELAKTRDYLQSMQEQHEAAIEETQCADEELESFNEELANRNAELNRLNNDLVNLQASTQLTIVLLGRDLTIRRFTGPAEKELGLLAADVGRPIGHIRHSLVVDSEAGEAVPLDLEHLVGEIIANVRENVREQAREVRDKAGCWHSLRLCPYLTPENKVDGAVLVLMDITELKRAQEASARLVAIVESSDDAIIGKDLEGVIQTWNPGAKRLFGYTAQEAIGQSITMLIPPERMNEESNILAHIRRGERIEHYETVRRRKDGTSVDIALTISPILDAGGRILGASKIAHDITERKRAEAALRKSEEQFRTLVEQIKDYAIFRTDPAGRAITHNSGVESILGFKEEEFIGQNIVPLIFTPEDVENGVAERELEQVAAEGVAGDDRWMRRNNGEHFFATGVTTALKNEDGELLGFIKVMRDQTEQKRIEATLQESERRYRRLFESAKDGILILDAQTLRITDANPFMGELLDYSLEQFKGKALWEIGLFQGRQESLVAMNKLQEEGYVRYEDLPLKSAQGRIQEVELIGNVYQVDDHAVIQCNIRDITERKRMEQEIAGQAKELADMNHRKDEFLAMLSHELRNPLVPIINMMQLLRLQKNENPLQQQAYTMIERQVEQLKVLINDLLEVSRITTGRIRFNQEKVDLRDIVVRALEVARFSIDQYQYELTVSQSSEPLWLRADSSRLEQVVTNLLTNAFKYTEKGGRIWLTTQQEDDYAVLRVWDTGVGIAPELLPHIFDLFTQSGKSLDRSQGGLGIGLCLVKQLVELHGGTVEAYSVLGEGSKFVVRLPLC